jgi:hypothetical protein
VGLELSQIIGRAMASDPHERYATANEFREALRRLGRVDEFGTMSEEEFAEGMAYLPPEPPAARFRAIATVLVILLASFAVFCHYYQWRMPDNNNSVPPYSDSIKDSVNDGARNEVTKTNGPSERHLRPRKRGRSIH